MIINRDYFKNPIIPPFVLTKANREYIGNGTLTCVKKAYVRNFSDLDELSFSVNLYNDGKVNSNYAAIDVMKYILVPDVGFFYIESVDVESEGTEHESKNVVAKSYDGLIAQKYLELFTINMGTTESIDGVQFY